MRYLTVSEVIKLYRQVMEVTGGTVGILSKVKSCRSYRLGKRTHKANGIRYGL